MMSKRPLFFAALFALGMTAFGAIRHALSLSFTDASPQVLTWWAFLCSVSIVNVLFWSEAFQLFRRERADLLPEERRFRRRQLALSAVYVAVCAFRATLPRAYVRRIVLVDSWLSSIALGRTLATFAETAFAAQLALTLHRLAKQTGATRVSALSYWIVPLLFAANCLSWCGTLTTNFLFPAVEITLWAVTIALCLVALARLWPRVEGGWRVVLAVLFVGGAFDVLFRVTVDIPMYVHRFLADRAEGRIYLGIIAGFRDCATHWHVTRSIADWTHERLWMSLYFSVTVWFSVLLSRTAFTLKRR
jgi:hypothetical protein